jgi:hypothetical protein
VARRTMSSDEPPLASLIERSAELKRTLVDFALSPRFERHLEQFMLGAADPYLELSEGEAIGVIDRFALQHRLPNGKTVLDQFLAGWPDLTAADREMLRGWRDPVEGIFEIRRKNQDSLVLLNLLDDLEYHVYSNMGPAAFRRLPAGTVCVPGRAACFDLAESDSTPPAIIAACNLAHPERSTENVATRCRSGRPRQSRPYRPRRRRTAYRLACSRQRT